MNKDNLNDIISDDDLGLLEIKKKAASMLPQDKVVQSFLEINDFVKHNGRSPIKGEDLHERKLAARLENFRTDLRHKDLIIGYDEYHLLDGEFKQINDIEDIFSDDDLGVLDVEDESIFKLQNVPKISKKLDEVARRKVCRDFENYEPLFIQVHEDLKNGKRQLEKFVDNKQLDKGVFFVAGGLLGVIVSADLVKDDQGRRNGRIYCVFENGTESNLLFQSLVRYLTVDYPGRIVVDVKLEERLFDTIDQKAGYIYVLKSLSDNEEILNTKNLYKIGFSEIDISGRIKNAAQDPTFLMAPVKIVSSYECYNMNTQRLERLLHRFFSEVKLNIDITDINGDRYTPKEWFIAPIVIINEVIRMVVDGSIVNYRYDAGGQKIVAK